jgi:catechol 2,3-dioxygenase-like lactoylglutathione lyase family enzyme
MSAAGAAADERLRVLQIGANTSDLPATARLFAEVFGFRNAGATMLWGQTIGVQGLPADGRAILWWLVGAQPFFQLEFFHHTRPVQRPKARDWTPADHGWGRFGIAVGDFDDCLARLSQQGVAPLTPPVEQAGARRVAFLEPWLMTIVEVIEAAVEGPEVVYVASSVSDLESARAFYRDVLGLEILEDDGGRDDLWGMTGVRRRSFAARAGNDVRLEIVQYEQPTGRPRASDYRTSDQGVVNVCLGHATTPPVERAFERAAAAGIASPRVIRGDGLCCGYLTDPDREVELAAIPEHRQAGAGFVAASPFLG